MKVIIVLGSRNDASGQLSTTALARAETALAEYQRRPGCKLLLTGGYGSHFNTTARPHASYVAEFLTSRGVPPADIMEFAESSNTIEDAILAKRVLERHAVDELTVVSSDFHVPRARLIFERVFPAQAIQFIEAPAGLEPDEYERACQREQESIRKIEESGFPLSD